MSKYKFASKQSSSNIKTKRHLDNFTIWALGEGLSADELIKENDFIKYLSLLVKFAQRYCVMVAASDTPCGPAFSYAIGKHLTDVGFTINLSEKFRIPYVGVINAGTLLIEELASVPSKPVEKKIELGGHQIEIKSVGFYAKQTNVGQFTIDDKCVFKGMRGLNFVVYDIVTDTVIDTVNFDTYADNFPCRRPSARNDELKEINANFNNQNISLFTYSAIPFPEDSWTANEAFIRKNALNIGRIAADISAWNTALDYYYDKKIIQQVLAIPPSHHGTDGARHLDDFHTEAVNIVGGHRITSDQPKNRNRSIFIVGGCTVFGVGSDDKNTIASHLQRMLNDAFPEYGIIVQNYGFFLAEMDARGSFNEELAIIRTLPVKEGDIVLYGAGYVDGIPFIDGSDISTRNGAELFFDQQHFTPDGNRVIAENIFNGLKAQDCLSKESAQRMDALSTNKAYGFTNNQSAQLSEYKKILSQYYDEMFVPVIGSIVMNCNPFTLGHRYLIDEALMQSDFLCIFVVEEDKSAFAFEERLKMVDDGTKDLDNVAVIPSGNFVLSTLTFSEYFNKSKLQNKEINPSKDILVFAKEIAPCLHIAKRFAGEEPTDTVTRQYNDTMRRILPEYGIEFIEIPRKKYNGQAISASVVRQYFDAGMLEEIRNIVPESTYSYLCAKVRGNHQM